MRTIVEVSCIDQNLKIENAPLIASGGVHENFIAFNFCSKWDGMEKTGVFYVDGKKAKPYYSVVDATNLCEVPYEVTANAGVMYFGVFGVLGDVIKTSKIEGYKVKQGAITSELVPTDPSPDIWQQLLASYNDVLLKVEESNKDQQAFIGEANKAVIDCNTATAECRDAVAMLNYSASDLDGGDPSTEEVVEDQNNIDGGSPY